MKKISPRIFALLATLSLVLALASCGATPDPDDKETPDEPTLEEILADITGDNVFIVTYEKVDADTVRATVSVAGTVSFAGFSGTLSYDSALLTVEDSATNNVTLNTANAGQISFSFAQTSNHTTAVTLFTVDFAYAGGADALLDLEIAEASNAALSDVPFSAKDATVTAN